MSQQLIYTVEMMFCLAHWHLNDTEVSYKNIIRQPQPSKWSLIMEKLKTYGVYIKVFVLGENEEDAFDTAQTAVDMSDLLDQDGVLGFEVVDDVTEEDTDENDEE